MSPYSDPQKMAARLLQEAAETTNMKERGRLIDEAMHWHNLAMDERSHRDGTTNDNEGEAGQATG